MSEGVHTPQLGPLRNEALSRWGWRSHLRRIQGSGTIGLKRSKVKGLSLSVLTGELNKDWLLNLVQFTTPLLWRPNANRSCSPLKVSLGMWVFCSIPWCFDVSQVRLKHLLGLRLAVKALCGIVKFPGCGVHWMFSSGGRRIPEFGPLPLAERVWRQLWWLPPEKEGNLTIMSYSVLDASCGFHFLDILIEGALNSALCVNFMGHLLLWWFSIISGDLRFGEKVQDVLCYCFSAFSHNFYLWNTMIFISYSSSFCPGLAPTDALSFLFVLNDNKWIIILNAMSTGGGTFLKLRLHLILFWKLLEAFSKTGLERLHLGWE